MLAPPVAERHSSVAESLPIALVLHSGRMRLFLGERIRLLQSINSVGLLGFDYQKSVLPAQAEIAHKIARLA